MQQTQTYKLNLIETSDTFSPAPLNENMEKVEAGISAEAAARAAETAALSQRVTMLELHKIATGTYTGDNTSGRLISTGFTPVAVVLWGMGVTTLGVSDDFGHAQLRSGGFEPSTNFNNSGTTYAYLAIC